MTDPDTNIYAILKTPDAEAMLVKAQLAKRIADTIAARRLTQAMAAEIIGMSQPKLSEMLRGRFRGISEAKMMECLTALGKDIEIIVSSAPRGRVGHVRVSTAPSRTARKAPASA